MRNQHLWIGLAGAILISAAPSQTVVSGGGPALQNAIAAASVGDTLVVQAGTYDPVLVDKGLTVLCDPNVGFTNTAQNISVQIHVIPAGQTVRWFGGEMLPSAPKGEFRVFLCDGVVEVEGVVSQNCIVNDSAQTSFTDCAFTERTQADNSVVAYSNCNLHRLQSCIGAVCSSLEVVDGAVATVIDTEIIGPPGFGFIFPAKPGIYVDNSTVRLAGAGTTVTGGGLNIAAIQVGALGATIDQDPLSTLNGAVVGGTANVTTVPAVSTTGGASGQVIPLTTYGEPGSFAFAIVGLPIPRVPTPFGELWILPPGVVAGSGIVPPGGELTSNFTVPCALALVASNPVAGNPDASVINRPAVDSSTLRCIGSFGDGATQTDSGG